MPRQLCLFDPNCRIETPSFQNKGKKDALEKEDLFSVDGEWTSLEKYFSKDMDRFQKEISPRKRLQYMMDNHIFKYRNDPKKGEFITIDGKELKITKELLAYIDEQDKLFYQKDTEKSFARRSPPRAHDNTRDIEYRRYNEFKKLSHMPNHLRELLRSIGLQYLTGKAQ